MFFFLSFTHRWKLLDCIIYVSLEKLLVYKYPDIGQGSVRQLPVLFM